MFQPKPLLIGLSYPPTRGQLIGERERSKKQHLQPRDAPPQARQDSFRPWSSRSAAEETSGPATGYRDQDPTQERRRPDLLPGSSPMVCPHRAWQRIMSLVIQAMPERGAIHGEEHHGCAASGPGSGPTASASCGPSRVVIIVGVLLPRERLGECGLGFRVATPLGFCRFSTAR